MARKNRRSEADPRKAVGYVRVSKDEQHLSPEAQRAALVGWAARAGAELVAVLVDAVSGAAPLDKRPGLVAALDALEEHGAGVLLVAKRDRLARDVVAAALVERLAQRAGARVVSAAGEGTDGEADDPTAKLLRTMIDAFAEYERALIRARTRAALAVKRARGEKTGGACPLGFGVAEDGRTLVPDADEARAVKRARTLRARGVAFGAIAERLNAEGVPCRGSRWHKTTVVRLLARTAARSPGGSVCSTSPGRATPGR